MKKYILTILGSIVLILLLAGAAFVGARLLNGQSLPQLSSANIPFLSLQQGGRNRAHNVDIELSKDMPPQAEDLQGLFDHRQDNSIFVGTGDAGFRMQKEQGGKVTVDATHDGPTIEVVVTTQTKIFHDVTMEQFNGQPRDGQSIPQVLEPGTLDNIGQFSQILVWGKKTGDRYIADILVYTSAAFIKR